mgnify:CR=1 FL=1
MLRLLFLARLQKQKRNKKTRKVESNQMIKLELLNNADFKNLIKVVDKLEQRIATLEKVIGKLQLRLGDVVLYIDKKGEEND